MATTFTPDPLSTFMGQEFLRNSQFVMFMPAFEPFITAGQSRNISLFCESVEFPGLNNVSTDYKIPGLNRQKITYGKDYPDVTFTFIHNVETPIYKSLIDWMGFISGGASRNGTEVQYFDSYTTSLYLYQLVDVPKNQTKRFSGLSNILNNIDKFNARFLNSNNLFNATDVGQQFVGRFNEIAVDRQPKGKYYDLRFYSAYPVSIAPVASNWGDDGFQRVSATFSYEYFTINENV